MAIWAWPVTVLGNTLRGVLFQFVPRQGLFCSICSKCSKIETCLFLQNSGIGGLGG